jgi:competence protein ComEA
MKRLLRSYTSFNKTERAGLVGLLAILFLLIVLRISLSYIVSVKPDDLKRRQLIAKWQGLKQNKLSSDYASGNKIVASAGAKETQPADIQQETPTLETRIPSRLFPFDPNTLDSQGFRKLGLTEKTTAVLLNWRAKGKIFRRKDELRKVYTLKEEEYLRLEPFIAIETAGRAKKINLNSADSTDLVYLDGIGPKLAHRIIEYRKKNGPFRSYDQLYEVYRFPDSVFQQLSRELSLN